MVEETVEEGWDGKDDGQADSRPRRDRYEIYIKDESYNDAFNVVQSQL